MSSKERRRIGLSWCLHEIIGISHLEQCGLPVLGNEAEGGMHFVGGMNTISEQMKDITSNFDMVKAQTAYERAIANNEGQYQALDAFLETASESIQAFDGMDSNISDAEIDCLINNEAVEAEDDIDQEIDKKINDIQARLQV